MSGQAILYMGRIVFIAFTDAEVVTTNSMIRITFLSSEKDLWVFLRTFLLCLFKEYDPLMCFLSSWIHCPFTANSSLKIGFVSKI